MSKKRPRHLYDLINAEKYRHAIPSGGLEQLPSERKKEVIHRIVRITDISKGYSSVDFLELEIIFKEKGYTCRCISLASTDPDKIFTEGGSCNRPLCFAAGYAMGLDKGLKTKIEIKEIEERS